MQRRSPTLEGFRLMLSRPALGLGELLWRWSFGATVWLTALLSTREYLSTLPVKDSDLLLLRTRQPALISQAILHIFRGSSARVVQTAVLLLLSLSMAWIVVASLGRAATLKAIIGHFRTEGSMPRTPLRSLLGIHFFRVAIALAAFVGYVAAMLLAGTATSPTDPAPGSAMLIFLTVLMLVGMAWSFLNWILSLAAIFVVARGSHTFGAIASALEMCRTRPAALAAVSTWFGLAHLVAFSVATSVVAFPLAFASVLPFSMVFGGVLFVTLFYFAVVDYLYAGRLAAYVAILELPEPLAMPDSGVPSIYAPQLSLASRVDPDELILSDVSV
jgi:hypothetical protein